MTGEAGARLSFALVGSELSDNNSNIRVNNIDRSINLRRCSLSPRGSLECCAFTLALILEGQCRQPERHCEPLSHEHLALHLLVMYVLPLHLVVES